MNIFVPLKLTYISALILFFMSCASSAVAYYICYEDSATLLKIILAQALLHLPETVLQALFFPLLEAIAFGRWDEKEIKKYFKPYRRFSMFIWSAAFLQFSWASTYPSNRLY